MKKFFTAYVYSEMSVCDGCTVSISFFRTNYRYEEIARENLNEQSHI